MANVACATFVGSLVNRPALFADGRLLGVSRPYYTPDPFPRTVEPGRRYEATWRMEDIVEAVYHLEPQPRSIVEIAAVIYSQVGQRFTTRVSILRTFHPLSEKILRSFHPSGDWILDTFHPSPNA